jgi:hypothetical protein
VIKRTGFMCVSCVRALQADERHDTPKDLKTE